MHTRPAPSATTVPPWFLPTCALLLGGFGWGVTLLPSSLIQAATGLTLGILNLMALVLVLRRGRNPGPEQRGWRILGISMLLIMGANAALALSPTDWSRVSPMDAAWLTLQIPICIVQIWALLAWPFTSTQHGSRRKMNLLGGMLFGRGGFGGGGGGGIGMILLLAGIGYLVYRFVIKNRADEGSYGQPGKVIQMNDYQSQNQGVSYAPVRNELEEGLSYIRQMDPAFDERRFNDNVMDMFFKIQGAFMNRDLSSASGLLTDEMRGLLQRDVDTLVREKKVNRLENIAVRSVEISEAWQESGKDFVTAMVYANLLDYTTDDTSGAVISGSKTEPVKFEEYWTFTRPVGNNSWKLSAINQK